MFPVIKPKSVLSLFAVLVIILHVSHVASTKLEVAEDEAVMENMVSPAQLEDSEMNAEASDTIEKRKIRISCRCWIGWRGKEGRKYHNFGVIRKFKWYEIKKQSKCSASCSKKCAPFFVKNKKNYDYLCQKVGKKYHYKQHKVGCFSKVGNVDLPSNLWDFDGSPHKLCCKVFRRSCKSVYGYGFYWHSGLKLCVKYLSPGLPQYSGCIPDVPNGPKKPPVCCYANKVYVCQKAKYRARSVKCW